MERFEEIETIGRGAFGRAILAKDRASGAQRVIKQINVFDMSEKQRVDATTEVYCLALLNHPCIIAYHENFIHDSLLCIVMDYASEGDLYGVIQQKKETHKRFDEEQVIRWFTQVALGLKHCHDKKILHRDLKSQNVFLQGGRAKLGDFGIAKLLSGESDFARTMVGSPYNMSPEIYEDKPYNTKSDMWSMGCLLYEMTTLTHAFDGQTLPALVLKIMKGQYPEIGPEYSTELAHLIDTLLRADPDGRPSVDEVLLLRLVRRAMLECAGEYEADVLGNLGGTLIGEEEEEEEEEEELEEDDNESDKEDENEVGVVKPVSSGIVMSVGARRRRQEQRGEKQRKEMVEHEREFRAGVRQVQPKVTVEALRRRHSQGEETDTTIKTKRASVSMVVGVGQKRESASASKRNGSAGARGGGERVVTKRVPLIQPGSRPTSAASIPSVSQQRSSRSSSSSSQGGLAVRGTKAGKALPPVPTTNGGGAPVIARGVRTTAEREAQEERARERVAEQRKRSVADRERFRELRRELRRQQTERKRSGSNNAGGLEIVYGKGASHETAPEEGKEEDELFAEGEEDSKSKEGGTERRAQMRQSLIDQLGEERYVALYTHLRANQDNDEGGQSDERLREVLGDEMAALPHWRDLVRSISHLVLMESKRQA